MHFDLVLPELYKFESKCNDNAASNQNFADFDIWRILYQTDCAVSQLAWQKAKWYLHCNLKQALNKLWTQNPFN